MIVWVVQNICTNKVNDGNQTYLKSEPARPKFTDIKQININELKLRPIIDQTCTNLQSCRLKNYCPILVTISHKCIYLIGDTLSFPDVLWENSLDSNEEYVPYDVVKRLYHPRADGRLMKKFDGV